MKREAPKMGFSEGMSKHEYEQQQQQHLTRYQAGARYTPQKARWTEGTDFNWRAHTLELRMFFSGLTRHDIQEITKGRARLAFTVQQGIIFFCFEFGRACPMSDNSYTYWLVSEDEQTPPPASIPENEGASLVVILVSAEDGIIRGLRVLALPHDFSEALFAAIRHQIARGKPAHFSRAMHEATIERIYRRFPRSEALYSEARWKAGITPAHPY